MKPFAYVNAANEKEAIAALGPDRGRFLPLAGGMDLLGLMKDYVAQPDRLLGLSPLKDQQLAGLVMMGEQMLTLGICSLFLMLLASVSIFLFETASSSSCFFNFSVLAILSLSEITSG